MLAALILLTGTWGLLFAKPALAEVPPGFEKVITPVESPAALAFTPDGRMLLTSKSGQVWV